jgi:tetratricopeptide (TPR) repeat protein
MFEIFKKDISIGDKVKLYLTTGKEPEGIVLEIGENFVLLQLEDSIQVKFFDKLVGGWEVLNKKPKENLLPKTYSLSRIARELNIGVSTIIEKLKQIDIVVDVNPNSEVSADSFEFLKSEFEEVDKEINRREIEAYLNEKIKNENSSMPYTDSQLWRSFITSTGIRAKRKSIVSARKRLGFEDHLNRNTKQSEETPVSKKTTTFNSLTDLANLYEKQQLESFISPNAEINRYFTNFLNGSAKNEEVDRILFKNDVVCDSELMIELENFKKGDLIPIVCNYSKSGKGAYAYLIFKPCSVDELIKKTRNFILKRDKKKAFTLFRYIKSMDLQNELLVELNSQISSLPDIINFDEDEVSPIEAPEKKSEIIDLNQIYEKARKLRLRKDFDESEKQFKILIENNFQLDSAAKDLADQYREQGRINEAITLIEKHINDFEKPLQANNFLYDLYVNTGNLEKAKNVLLKIVDTPFDNSNKIEVRRRGKVLARLGALFLKNGEEEEANKFFKRSYELYPDNKLLSNTKKIKGKHNSRLNLKDKNQTYLSRLIYGVTPFVERAFEDCNYEGIPPAVKEKRKFSEETLFELNKELQKNSIYGYNLPKSRAAFYLTKAKLMHDLELSESDEYFDTIATYCFSMARVSLVERWDIDYCIEWYNNGFKLERTKEKIIKETWRYIQALLHYKIGKPIKDESANEVLTLDLADLIQRESNTWNYFILLSQNSPIAGEIIIENLNKLPLGKYLIADFLDSNKISKEDNSVITNWNQLIIKYSEKEQETFSKVNNIIQRENINDFINYFHTIKNHILDSLLLQVNRFRFETIGKMILSVESFLISVKFDDKEIYYTDFENKYNILMNEIRGYSTNLSLSLLLQIISQLNKLTRNKYNEFIDATLPIVNLNIEGDCIINDSGDCDIQVSISNSPNCSPISDIVISIKESEELVLKNSSETFSTTLRGGGEPIIGRFTIHFPEVIVNQGAADLIFNYKFRILTTGEEKSQSKTLSIVFYDSKNFVEVQNPYAEHAKSNIVENPEMFKGRTELINKIYNTVMSTKSKGYVVYGQKRSGKSSVLWHLENKFNSSLKAFAVYYQTGLSIAQDNNVEANFYYRILTTIERKINKLKSLGETVPAVGKTNLKELMLNPPIVFYDRLNEIKTSFNESNEWRDKKLVLIIDEFTYIFYQIKKGTISQTFMQNWKAFIEDGGFSVVVSGQDTMKQFMQDFPNEFGMFKPERLTYLDREAAKELIDEPVWDKANNRSRYTRDSIDKIISLTACSPFYIQIICNELVRFMNSKKKPVLTPRDVEDVVFSLCKGQNSLTEFDFENLLSAGDKQLDKIKPEEAFAILSEIAKLTKTLNFARREDIAVYSSVKDNDIINDMLERAVLEEESVVSNRYKIQVQLFKDWLNFNNN